MADKPDSVFPPPRDGDELQVTVWEREKPWRVRLGGYDLLIVVGSGPKEPGVQKEPGVGVESEPVVRDEIAVRPEGRRVG